MADLGAPAGESASGNDRSDARPFERFASGVSRRAGHPATFCVALGAVVVWAVSGPLSRFSDTWQLLINTGTTVLTFLMVFVIQNTMNRDSIALHIKLDELIRVTSQARDALIGVEDLDEARILEIRQHLNDLALTEAPDADGNG